MKKNILYTVAMVLGLSTFTVPLAAQTEMISVNGLEPTPSYVAAGYMMQGVGNPLVPRIYHTTQGDTEFIANIRWNSEAQEWSLVLYQSCLGNLRLDKGESPADGCWSIPLAAFYMSQRADGGLHYAAQSGAVPWNSVEITALVLQFWIELSQYQWNGSPSVIHAPFAGG